MSRQQKFTPDGTPYGGNPNDTPIWCKNTTTMLHTKKYDIRKQKKDFDPQPETDRYKKMFEQTSHTETTEAVEMVEEQIREIIRLIEYRGGGVVGGNWAAKEITKLLTTIRKETLEETLDISWDWIVEAARKEEWGREDYKQYLRDRLQALKK